MATKKLTVCCIQCPREAHLNDEKQLSCVDKSLELMMDEDLWIPIVMFISIAVVFSLWFYFKYKTKLASQQTFRLALEKGSELSPEFMKQLADPEPPKDRDLRRGLVWLALAVGLALCGLAVPDPTGDALQGCLAGAAFPFAIGIAFLIMYRYGARKA